MARIILSVPHAACRSENDKINHTCDIVAERVARKLFDLLTDKGHKVMLRIAGVNRLEVDYNRVEGRGTEWRKNLERDFAKADYLCDIHSFPYKFHWPVDFYILKWTDQNGGDNRELVYDLMDHVVKKDLNAAVAYSEKHNDIVANALENNLPATLVEFSEQAIADGADKVITAFADALDSFVKRFEKEEKVTSESQPVDLLPRLFE